jgi:hypothetical protein
MKYRHEFPDIEKMRLTWSQSSQELFAITMVNGKKSGTFLEIGSAWPIRGNNTYILEKYFHYRGISIDIRDDYEGWREERPHSNLLIQNAVTIDYPTLLKNYPDQIDYLQIDIDDEAEAFSVLESVLASGHRFSAITFETDLYVDLYEGGSGNHGKFKKLAKQSLEDSGYELLIENVGCVNGKPEQITYDQLVPFEDWYIDPTAVDKEISGLFRNIGSDLIDPNQIFQD